MTPHYDRRAEVLGNPRRNIEYRRAVLKAAENSQELRDDLVARCREDILFYTNVFAFTYDPRQHCGVVPFITYPFQNDALLRLQGAIGNHDLVVEKSRDMGASWLCLLAFDHRWRFFSAQSLLLGSRTEQYVDESGNPKSLFWKLDFLRNHQPDWLVPAVDRRKLHLENLALGSVISGESTTGDFARGDRRTAVMLDEFAFVPNGDSVMSATADVTASRILNSTPNGTANAFYGAVRNPSWEKLTLHWTAHPVKAAGLFYDADNKPRSPWYDKECERRTPQQIACELDINYEGSGYQFFDSRELARLERECYPPYHIGELDYIGAEGQPVGFLTHERGTLRLWCHIDAAGRPIPPERCVMGVDVAVGSQSADGRGASNSVASVYSVRDGRKVAELAVSGMDPVNFARYCVALARWFSPPERGCHMIWEVNGPGALFGKTVVHELRYTNVYMRRNETRIGRNRSDMPGFHSSLERKRDLLGQYRGAIADGRVTNPSLPAIQEMTHYIHLPNGGVGHSGAVMGSDPTQSRENHGDRVIADALACKLIVDGAVQPKKNIVDIVQPGSLAYRLRETERQEAMKLAGRFGQW